MKRVPILLVGAALAVAGVVVGCESPTPETTAEKHELRSDAQAALQRMYDKDPSLRSVVEGADGYAVFPEVGKAGLIVGGAGGRGAVYEHGQLIGYATLSQATVGAQIGGQNFDELIVFQDQAALQRFQRNEWTPAANATAVAVQSGTGAGTSFKDGVATLVLPTSGMMAEASIGGQKFVYQPLGTVSNKPSHPTEPNQ